MIDYDQRVALLRDQLIRTQLVTNAQLAETRTAALRALVAHARSAVPYYRDRLPAPADISPARWSTIPILRRVDVQDRSADLTAVRLPPGSGRATAARTSGSTGRPLDYLHDDGHDLANAAQTDRILEIWGFDGRKRLATFLSMYDDPAKRDIRRYGWRFGFPEGVREILEISNSIGAQLNWLESVKVDYLYARGGSHLAELADLSLRRGGDLRFAKILCNGSRLSPAAAALAKKAFRGQVVDLYGASETGVIAYTCPDCRQMHTCDETILVEILRDDGSDCEPGEIGRVVLTPLKGYAMPLIRYEIGDYAVRGARKARCGRPYGTLGAITGRYRGSFVLRDGSIIHPYANATRIGEHLSYRQIQLVQTAYEQLEIRYVPASGADPAPNRSAIEALFRQFMPDVVVTLVPVAGFTLDPTGKFEETLSLVARPPLVTGFFAANSSTEATPL